MPVPADVPVLVFDSVTKLPPEADGAVVIGASHAAVYAAYMSAKFGCRAAIHHDAGIGKDEAGVSGLAYADRLGMAMAAVATASARIGDGADLQARGIISRANGLAAACGVVPGMPAREAAVLLRQGDHMQPHVHRFFHQLLGHPGLLLRLPADGLDLILRKFLHQVPQLPLLLRQHKIVIPHHSCNAFFLVC